MIHCDIYGRNTAVVGTTITGRCALVHSIDAGLAAVKAEWGIAFEFSIYPQLHLLEFAAAMGMLGAMQTGLRAPMKKWKSLACRIPTGTEKRNQNL